MPRSTTPFHLLICVNETGIVASYSRVELLRHFLSLSEVVAFREWLLQESARRSGG